MTAVTPHPEYGPARRMVSANATPALLPSPSVRGQGGAQCPVGMGKYPIVIPDQAAIQICRAKCLKVTVGQPRE